MACWNASSSTRNEAATSRTTRPLAPEQHMFERFTDQARRMLVFAQEEAVSLSHSCIGPEHLLLGLMRANQGRRVNRLRWRRRASPPTGEGAGYEALVGFGISLEALRQEVKTLVAPGDRTSGVPPFLPASKKALEQSMHEAHQLGHDYVSSDHLLLAVLCDGDGVAAQSLTNLGADASRIRQRVLELLDPGDRGLSTEPGEAG